MRVHVLYAIGIVPYGPDHSLRARADAVYAPENERYSRDHERDDPDYDLRTLDGGVSRMRNASGERECRLTGAAA
jgi:hypothetical protein